MTLCGDNWLYEEASLEKSGIKMPTVIANDKIIIIQKM
jgi:hypothetical protein